MDTPHATYQSLMDQLKVLRFLDKKYLREDATYNTITSIIPEKLQVTFGQSTFIINVVSSDVYNETVDIRASATSTSPMDSRAQAIMDNLATIFEAEITRLKQVFQANGVMITSPITSA